MAPGRTLTDKLKLRSGERGRRVLGLETRARNPGRISPVSTDRRSSVGRPRSRGDAGARDAGRSAGPFRAAILLFGDPVRFGVGQEKGDQPVAGQQ